MTRSRPRCSPAWNVSARPTVARNAASGTSRRSRGAVPALDLVFDEAKVPPQGARVDVAFAGLATGRLTGSVKGVDYLRIRADGRIDLDIHATIETNDGCRIALSAAGVGTPRSTEPIADLCENVRLTTAAEAYAWVNARQVWAVGTVNLATGKIHLDAYLQ